VVLALVTVLVAAVFFLTWGYATGLFGPKDLAERVRRSVQVKASKDPTVVDHKGRGGTARYYNWFWIEAPPEIMNEIAKVIYRMQPPHGDYPGLNRQDGFKSGYLGVGPWAGSDVDVIVVLRDGREVTLKFDMVKAVRGG